MPNQDYIGRQPAPKKKKNPYKKQATAQPESNNIKNKIVVSVILLLVGFFIYGLWLLKNSPETKNPSQAIASETVEKKINSLPKPPKEKWRYVDTLKNKEVEVGQYEVTQQGPYKMQCGSFKTRAQAETLKANIAFTGIESQIQTAQGTNGTWYKVVLGPYSRKRAAEQDKHKLRNNKINGCQIWLWK